MNIRNDHAPLHIPDRLCNAHHHKHLLTARGKPGFEHREFGNFCNGGAKPAFYFIAIVRAFVGAFWGKKEKANASFAQLWRCFGQRAFRPRAFYNGMLAETNPLAVCEEPIERITPGEGMLAIYAKAFQ